MIEYSVYVFDLIIVPTPKFCECLTVSELSLLCDDQLVD